MQHWHRSLILLIVGLLQMVTCSAITLQCPAPSALTLDTKTLLWSTTDGDYKSYAPSFSKHATSYIGSQWQGVNVGNLFCLYRGDELTFTISLQHYALIQEPHTGKWGPNVNGIRNCHATQPEECPFSPVTAKKPHDVNQELEQLKVDAPVN